VQGDLNSSHLGIRGERAREAIDSLGGYAYQLYQSAIAWGELEEDGILLLEVAEDYATCIEDALKAVQVKRTSSSITSNSKSVCQAIDSLLELQRTNPKLDVSLRYLTTSAIGRETKIEDRVGSIATLNYWQALSSSEGIPALRERLMAMQLSDDSKASIAAWSDEELYERLVKKLEFDCGEPGIDGVRQKLQDLLVIAGDKKGLYAEESEKALPRILERVLLVCSSHGRRELKRADFIRIFEAELTTQVPNALIRDLSKNSLKQLTGDQDVSIVSHENVLEPLFEGAQPSPFAKRTHLARRVEASLDRGNVWLFGGSGFGKTLLAKTALLSRLDRTAVLRLRDQPPERAAYLLNRAVIELLTTDYDGLLIDDVSDAGNARVADDLERLTSLASMREKKVVVCSYQKPSPSILSRVGVHTNSCIEIGLLTDADIADLAAGAPSHHEVWQNYVRLGSSNGHPQLAHALAVGLEGRDWPTSDLGRMNAILGNDEALNITREEARRRILTELPDEERRLIYRLSLTTGTFTREMAKALADAPPPIAAAGEALDRLVGPWIDQVSSGEFQVSPLAAGSGTAQLNEQEQKVVHAKIAKCLIGGRQIDSSRLDQLLLSGFVGEAEQALMALVFATLSTDSDKVQILAQNTMAFKVWRTDQQFYPKNARLSVMLRMAQSLIVLADGDVQVFRKCFDAFHRELDVLGDEEATSLLKLTLYGKLLLHPNLAEAYPEFPQLVAEAAEAAEQHGISEDYELSESAGYEHMEISMPQALFTMQMSNLKTLKTLETVLGSLSEISEEQRERLVPPIDEVRFNPEQIVKSIWVKEKAHYGYNADSFAESLISTSRVLESLGETEFAIGCYLTAAVVQSEETKDHAKGLATLDAASERYGERFSLRRGRAAVYFNQDRHAEQIAAVEPYLDEAEKRSWIEMTYLHRELGIAHGSLENWAEAEHHFDVAKTYSEKVQIEAMDLMAIGLIADRAVCQWYRGSHVSALVSMRAALDLLAEVDPNSGFNANALHRLVMFTGWWIYAKYNDLKEVEVEANTQMVIGCNSNPNPHSGLGDPPIGSPTMIFYLLAEVDVGNGGGADIWEEVVSRFSETEAILSQECLLHLHIFQKALERRDGKTVAVFGPKAVDAMAAFPNIPQENLNPENPIFGKPQLICGDAWESGRLDRLSGITAMICDAIVSNDDAAIESLFTAVSVSDRPMIADNEIEAFNSATIQSNNPSVSTFGAIGEFHKSFRDGSRPIIPKLMVLSLRIFEVCQKAGQTFSATPTLADWLFGVWREAVAEERFRFSVPHLAENEIYAALNNEDRSLASIAKLILAIEPHVDVGLGESFIAVLREAANG
jgi:hypothetical protein